MKSFRLDPDSNDELVREWPSFVLAILGVLIINGISAFYPSVKTIIPVLLGIALGWGMTGRLRKRFPTARSIWLLSIGMTTCVAGVVITMINPSWIGGTYYLTWLGIAFFSILIFAILNRGNKDVVQ